MKNIKISIPFYICFIIFILIGKFKFFISLTLITFFHELGHILTGILLKYKLEKVIILPLGCYSIFNTKINNNIFKEIFVTIMGPIFQLVLLFLYKNYQEYNLYLLIFNLLPIYPLDGYKIFCIFLYNIFPFKKTLYISYIVSILLILTLILIRPTSIIIYIVSIVFIYQLIKEYKNINFVFNKFLFERYLYKIKYKNNKYINSLNLNKMYKYKSHTFLSENKLIEEEKILKYMFDKP